MITEAGSIEAFYHILFGLTCYGRNHWDMLGLGDDSSLSMQKQTREGRYLTLVTSEGMEIDTLKYTGISGMFYEYGGIAYGTLSEEEKRTIEEILNIERKEEEEALITKLKGFDTTGKLLEIEYQAGPDAVLQLQ